MTLNAEVAALVVAQRRQTEAGFATPVLEGGVGI